MHVLGASPGAIRQTALLRAHYYHLLQDGVVDLFVAAKRHAEQEVKKSDTHLSNNRRSQTLTFQEVRHSPF